VASGQPTTIDFEAERQFGVHKRLQPFTVRTPFGPDLGYLVKLLAANEIDPQIGLRASWNEISDAAEALLDRRIAGKAVLDVD
jgi:NADPH:quinone reductase-like Zn-dependent oxidoreductase